MTGGAGDDTLIVGDSTQNVTLDMSGGGSDVVILGGSVNTSINVKGYDHNTGATFVLRADDLVAALVNKEIVFDGNKIDFNRDSGKSTVELDTDPEAAQRVNFTDSNERKTRVIYSGLHGGLADSSYYDDGTILIGSNDGSNTLESGRTVTAFILDDDLTALNDVLNTLLDEIINTSEESFEYNSFAPSTK